MLQELGGRLSSESDDHGVRVEIPGIRRWDAPILGVFFLLAAMESLTGSADFESIDMSRLIFPACLACLGLCILLFNFFNGATILTVDGEKLKIVRLRFGINWRTRIFDTNSIANLRYIPSRWTFFPRIRWIPGTISFDIGFDNQRFGAGIWEEEAEAVIQTIAKFQKSNQYIWEPSSR